MIPIAVLKRLTLNKKPLISIQSMTDRPMPYHDSFLDLLFIRLFSRKMSIAVGQTTSLKGYEGFVDLSKSIMDGRSSHEQQAVVGIVLRSLMPSPVLWGIRTFFSPTKLVCELNAWFATQLFEWLVGPCSVVEAQIESDSGKAYSQKSGVHIEKCRYLEQSGCVGMCINMCKLPTQDFFTQEFGIPVTLTPNFENLSCEMIFGQMPPHLSEEAAYQQACLAEQCETANLTSDRCPKTHRVN